MHFLLNNKRFCSYKIGTSCIRAFHISVVKLVSVTAIKAACGCIPPCHLSLRNKWWWVISFTLLSLYSRINIPGINSTGGRMGTRAGLVFLEKRKSSGLCRESNQDLSFVQPVAILQTALKILFQKQKLLLICILLLSHSFIFFRF